MIRTKTKIFAEENNPNTVLSPVLNSPPITPTLLSGETSNSIKPVSPETGVRIYIADSEGKVKLLHLTGSNKAIGTDANGNIVLLDRSLL